MLAYISQIKNHHERKEHYSPQRCCSLWNCDDEMPTNHRRSEHSRPTVSNSDLLAFNYNRDLCNALCIGKHLFQFRLVFQHFNIDGVFPKGRPCLYSEGSIRFSKDNRFLFHGITSLQRHGNGPEAVYQFLSGSLNQNKCEANPYYQLHSDPLELSKQDCPVHLSLQRSSYPTGRLQSSGCPNKSPPQYSGRKRLLEHRFYGVK